MACISGTATSLQALHAQPIGRREGAVGLRHMPGPLIVMPRRHARLAGGADTSILVHSPGPIAVRCSHSEIHVSTSIAEPAEAATAAPAPVRPGGDGNSSSGDGDVSSSEVEVLLTSAENAAVVALAETDSESDEERDFRVSWTRKQRRIVLFVEPSPFDYVCGYKNRFQNFIRNLQEGGDQVLVVTTHKGCPGEFHGAKVIPSWSFPFPFYKSLPLSFGISPRIFSTVANFNADVIHATSPGVMCFGAMVIAKLLAKPLVFSYHTHVPVYIPKYTFSWLVGPMWAVLQFLHHAGDLTLVTSAVLGKELVKFNASAGKRENLWPKGIDCEIFNPKFKTDEMRNLLSGGESEKPLLVHVGRLGAEKNLQLLRPILDGLPEVRLAFVGDGPSRAELEALFAGTPTVFTGMLTGQALSEAYASGDIFLMPSETETLGFVVLEAMASGLPVVAARAGGIPDIINRDGVNGFLFEPGNVEDATAKVKALLDDRALRDRMANAGRDDVERFDWRAATSTVRHHHYSLAVWLHARSQLANSWRKWLPWWLKKSEWDTFFAN